MDTSALIVLNQPHLPFFQSLAKYIEQFACVIACDGGAKHLMDLDLVPHHIIGDFDSLDAQALQGLIRHTNATTHHKPSQYETDFEKALALCKQLNQTNVIVVGLLGGRMDHSLANAAVLFQGKNRGLNLCATDGREWVYPVHQEIKFISQNNERVSFVPFGPCKDVSILGLKYELAKHDFDYGAVGVSNQGLGIHAQITIGLGRGWLIKDAPL